MRIFENPNYDFIKYRWHAVVVSVILIGIGLAMLLTRGINLGIDFAGGANIVLKFRETPQIAQVRADLPQATIQQYGRAQENSLLIRLPKQAREGDYAGAVVEELHRKMNPEAASKHDLNYLGRPTRTTAAPTPRPSSTTTASPTASSTSARLSASSARSSRPWPASRPVSPA